MLHYLIDWFACFGDRLADWAPEEDPPQFGLLIAPEHRLRSKRRSEEVKASLIIWGHFPESDQPEAGPSWRASGADSLGPRESHTSRMLLNACLPNGLFWRHTHRCLKQHSHQQTVIRQSHAPGAANFSARIPNIAVRSTVHARGRASPRLCECGKKATPERLQDEFVLRAELSISVRYLTLKVLMIEVWMVEVLKALPNASS